MSRQPPKITVVTLAIPRLLTEQCIGSFIKHWVDRRNYHVKWICHLDQYGGLEHDFDANYAMIRRTGEWFDEAVICASCENIGLGQSYLRCFNAASPEDDLLIIEDDWLWSNDWALKDVMKSAADAFSFCKQTWMVGGTSPSFWRSHVLKTLLAEYPTTEPIRELSFKRILSRKHKFRHGGWGNVPRDCCTEIGRRILKNMGYTKNFAGRDL